MFKTATHITLSFLLLIVTTGFSMSKQSCEPATLLVNYAGVSPDHCAMPPEYCNAQITSIIIKVPFIETAQAHSVDQITEGLPSSVFTIQPDASDEEALDTVSTFKLPKIQTVLARLQSYLL